MVFNKKFILASTSKSRYSILRNVGLIFKKKNPLCNEQAFKKKFIKKSYSPKKISLELSRLKAKSISEKNINQLVLGSDTVIDFEGRQLSKAKNLSDAKKKVLLMSGKSHNIYSSASVFVNGLEVWHSTNKTKVTIRKLEKKEINNYIDFVGKDILSSVGCYQLEKRGPNIVEDIQGDYFNVLGLPLFSFLKFLKAQ